MIPKSSPGKLSVSRLYWERRWTQQQHRIHKTKINIRRVKIYAVVIILLWHCVNSTAQKFHILKNGWHRLCHQYDQSHDHKWDLWARSLMHERHIRSQIWHESTNLWRSCLELQLVASLCFKVLQRRLAHGLPVCSVTYSCTSSYKDGLPHWFNVTFSSDLQNK